MGELSEFSVIKQYFSDLGSGQATVIGPGDDCAVLHLPHGKELATSIICEKKESQFECLLT